MWIDMSEKEIRMYADNGQYSHSEIIDEDTGETVCFVCPICGGRWDKEDEYAFFEHTCEDSYSIDDLADWD